MQTIILIADRPAIVRSIRVALRSAAGFRVEDVLDGRLPCRDVLRAHAPDVVVVDEMCQRANVVARLREARDELSGGAVVLLSTGMDRSALDQAFEAGADAVISRRLKAPALSTVLREVGRGTVVTPSRPANGRSVAQLLDPLSREVARLLAEGLTVERVAEVLALSRVAVEAHVRSALCALGGPGAFHVGDHALAGSDVLALRSA